MSFSCSEKHKKPVCNKCDSGMCCSKCCYANLIYVVIQGRIVLLLVPETSERSIVDRAISIIDMTDENETKLVTTMDHKSSRTSRGRLSKGQLPH